MYIARDPSRSRPLSANVKRLMMLSRASPKNEKIQKYGRTYSSKDLVYCARQGEIFMEACAMGLGMEEFAPRFMTSQIAGIFDYYFYNDGKDSFCEILKMPVFMQNPAAVVEALYWIEDIISRAEAGENKSLLISTAYAADVLELPDKLKALPIEGNRNTDQLSYAYWLGYIYRCECLMHEESSRMVYGAFSEGIMRKAYGGFMNGSLADKTIAEAAAEICAELDRLFVESVWEEQGKRKRIEHRNHKEE